MSPAQWFIIVGAAAFLLTLLFFFELWNEARRRLRNDDADNGARRWQHVGMKSGQWFFIVGGAAFLLAALFLREMQSEAAEALALTFGLIGFFWLVPQLIFLAARNLRSK